MLLTVSLTAKTISFENFMKHVKNNHLYFKKGKLNKMIQIQEREALLGANDWQVNASSGISYEKANKGEIIDIETRKSGNMETNIEKRFRETGGTFKASYQFEYSKIGIKNSNSMGSLFSIPEKTFGIGLLFHIHSLYGKTLWVNLIDWNIS